MDEGGADVRDQPAPVAVDGEVRESVVARHVVERVAVERIVAGADGQPAEAEARPVSGVEQPLQRLLALPLVENGEGVPPLLVEGAAEALDRLVRRALEDRQVRVRSPAGLEDPGRSRLPVGAGTRDDHGDRTGRASRRSSVAAPQRHGQGGNGGRGDGRRSWHRFPRIMVGPAQAGYGGRTPAWPPAQHRRMGRRPRS